MNNPKNLLNFSYFLADRARQITKPYFRVSNLKIEDKADLSPVSVADRGCEEQLRKLIKENYPNHEIIGEEFGRSGNSDYQWIIDPIDGTKSFISGFPIWATLIALFYQGEPLLSIIDMPILSERFSALKGEPTKLNGQIIKTREIKELKKAISYSTSPTMFEKEQIIKYGNLQKEIYQQRFTGDAYSYAMLSAGWIDLVVEADMKPYDYLPLILIVENAGGIITDWQGNKLTLESKGEVLAAGNKILHQQALEILR